MSTMTQRLTKVLALLTVLGLGWEADAWSATGNKVAATSNPLRIGGDSVWGEYFNGLIDEVRIYNRALSPSEILTDMNSRVGG